MTPPRLSRSRPMKRLVRFSAISLFFVLLGLEFAPRTLAQADPCRRRRRTVPVYIESVPAGASVYLDSTTTPPLGTTGARFRCYVPRGSHTLIFKLADHEDARLSVEVRRRRETFRAVLRPLGTIEVSAGNEGAQGATVRVDGRAVGNGPLTTSPIRVSNLRPGRHQVRAEREGYRPFEQWIEVGGGQLARVPVMMERAAPDTGMILVAGQAGAEVFVDGQAAGTTPTLIEGVAVGPHTVEIRPPNGRPYSEQVTVVAGQRATVTPRVLGGGTLRVVSPVAEAVISIDGEAVGPSPAVREGLAPGEHIVEATAEGYERVQQTVTVEAGQQRVVSLEMTRIQGEAGQIVVEANVEGAAVLVDNEERGVAPAVVTPEPGTHAVVVRADGYQEYATTCETAPGQNCEISAVLVPQQVRVRVAVQPGVRNAELYVDGDLVGPVPYDGTLPAGSHLIEIRAEGHEPFRQQALLTPSSEVRPFDINLSEIRDGLTEAERRDLMRREARRRASTVTHSAATLPVDQAALDVSLGWPYLFELRLNVGLLDFLDAGFAVRSFGRLTEFEGRVRAGIRPLQQVAVGAQARFGGGIGPELGHRGAYYSQVEGTRAPMGSECYDNAPSSGPVGSRVACAIDRTGNGMADEPLQPSVELGYPVNSAFLSLEALGSLHFSEQGAFTLWVGVDFSTDEYAGHGLNSGARMDVTREGDLYCRVEGTSNLSCPREDYARARLGGSLELVLTRDWNIWFLLEGILSSQPRRIYGNLLGIETNDTQFYFRLGGTHKF